LVDTEILGTTEPVEKPFPRPSGDIAGCIRNGTSGIADGRGGRRETGPVEGRAAANSAMIATHRSAKRRRRSASETRSPLRLPARRYWRCSSKAGQKRAAEAKEPKPRSGS